MRLPWTGPVDLSALTSELKRRVPMLEGLSSFGEEIEARRLSGDFNPDEIVALQAGLAAHDPVAIDAARAARRTEQAALLAKPATTRSLPERVRLLELIHGME